MNGKELKSVEDFKYLGSWINTAVKDWNTRIALAWTEANKINTIWTATTSKDLKMRFFRSTAESILRYGCGTWALAKTMAKRINGNYTILLRKIQNTTWKEKKTNGELSNVIGARRLRLIGHQWQRQEECLHQHSFWELNHEKRSRGHPQTSFVEEICKDTNLMQEQVVQEVCRAGLSGEELSKEFEFA